MGLHDELLNVSQIVCLLLQIDIGGDDHLWLALNTFPRGLAYNAYISVSNHGIGLCLIKEAAQLGLILIFSASSKGWNFHMPKSTALSSSGGLSDRGFLSFGYCVFYNSDLIDLIISILVKDFKVDGRRVPVYWGFPSKTRPIKSTLDRGLSVDGSHGAGRTRVIVLQPRHSHIK